MAVHCPAVWQWEHLVVLIVATAGANKHFVGELVLSGNETGLQRLTKTSCRSLVLAETLDAMTIIPKPLCKAFVFQAAELKHSLRRFQ